MKEQKMRYSDAELELIKNTFAENDELLKALRKHFLQIDMLAGEKAILSGLNKEVLGLLRRFFLPVIIGDEPLNQVIDLWMTVGLQEKTPEDGILFIKARKLVIDYLEHALEELEGIETVGKRLTDFLDLKSKDLYINFLARNTIIQHIEQQLTQIYLLAGLKSETTQQTLERLKKNSNK